MNEGEEMQQMLQTIFDVEAVQKSLTERGFFDTEFYKVYDNAFKKWSKIYGAHCVTPEAASMAWQETLAWVEQHPKFRKYVRLSTNGVELKPVRSALNR